MEAPPPAWVCSISMELMIDPVILCTGQTYERLAIEAWLTTKAIDPNTGAILRSKELIPNHALRSTIEEWVTTATVRAREDDDAAQADLSRLHLKFQAASDRAARTAEARAAAELAVSRLRPSSPPPGLAPSPTPGPISSAARPAPQAPTPSRASLDTSIYRAFAGQLNTEAGPSSRPLSPIGGSRRASTAGLPPAASSPVSQPGIRSLDRWGL